jgi:predicted phosphodiesterase
MRCLVVADLHYSLPQFDWLVSAAPQFDLVIFAGDALDVGSSVDFRAQIVVVKKYLALLSDMTQVILCSGIMTSMSATLRARRLQNGSARFVNWG